MLNKEGIPYLGLVIGTVGFGVMATMPCDDGFLIGICEIGQLVTLIVGSVWVGMYLISLKLIKKVINPWEKLIFSLIIAFLITVMILGILLLGIRMSWW